jgi:hypothetical protein
MDEPRSTTRPRRRKKKQRPAEPAQHAELRPELDARGRERPRFLLAFPRHPELEPLIEAFERGDFARVRREAPALADRAEDPAVRAAALELRRRIDPDPMLKLLVLGSIALLLFLTAYAYLGHSH